MTPIQDWLVRALAVGVLVSLAAWSLDGVVRGAGRASRWVWLASMAATVGIPILAIVVPELWPRRVAESLPLEILPVITWPTEFQATPAPARPAAPPIDPLLVVWPVAVFFCVARYFWGLLRLRRAMRGRYPAVLGGAEVWVTSLLGPAVVGVFRPRVVVPAWVLNAGAEQQRMIVTHEREHARAGDQWLLALTPLLVAAFPWNLPLWWQQRRLRLAVELDCDARVLRAGVPALEYGSMLLEVAGGRALSQSTLAALTEPRTLLERRIRAMSTNPGQSVVRLTGLMLVGLSSAFAALLLMTPGSASLQAQTATTPAKSKPPVPVTVSRTQPMPVKVAKGQPMPVPAVTPSGPAVVAAPVIAVPSAKNLSVPATPTPVIAEFSPATVTIPTPARQEPDPIFVIDGVIMGPRSRVLIERLSIGQVEVLKPAAAMARFGDQARGGAILITTIREGVDTLRNTLTPRRTPTQPLIIVDGVRDTTTTYSLTNRRTPTQPLIIVDGVIRDDIRAESFNDLDPKNIESIEVIKGAAAATLYGERAKNGVISITTKKK